MMDKVATFRPGLLMIEIGTNYIDASCVTVDELAKTVFLFCEVVSVGLCGVQSDLLPRPASWPWTCSSKVGLL